MEGNLFSIITIHRLKKDFKCRSLLAYLEKMAVADAFLKIRTGYSNRNILGQDTAFCWDMM